MPASRVAFAFADLIDEFVRLQHRDARPQIIVQLDPESFRLLRSELGQRGVIQIKLGAAALEPYSFNGVTIECIYGEQAGAAS